MTTDPKPMNFTLTDTLKREHSVSIAFETSGSTTTYSLIHQVGSRTNQFSLATLGEATFEAVKLAQAVSSVQFNAAAIARLPMELDAAAPHQRNLWLSYDTIIRTVLDALYLDEDDLADADALSEALKEAIARIATGESTTESAVQDLLATATSI